MNVVPHILLALAAQAIIGVATGNWWLGFAAGSAYFVGREIAQAEYRWIERFGGGLRRNLPWWAPFDLRVWQRLDPWVDWLGPIAATFIVAVVASGLG